MSFLGKKVGNVVDVNPVGTQILVEEIRKDEIIDSKIIVDNLKTNDPTQVRIIKFGPLVENVKYGFKEGDRVIVTGRYVEAPRLNKDSKRILMLIEPHCIIAVLEEEDRG